MDGDLQEARSLELRGCIATLRIVDNAHAIEVEAHGPDALIRGRHVEPMQFHFQAASAHTIDAASFPHEGHFVSEARRGHGHGHLAMVGVMDRDSDSTRLADEVRWATPAEGGIEREDLAMTLPRDKRHRQGLGSSTTPPLTESVAW